MGSQVLVILVSDLVASTELRSRLGEEAAEQLRREHDGLLSDAVLAHNGSVVKGLGDGVLATFEAAADAVAASETMQRSIHRLSRRRDLPLAIRVGISAGDVTCEDDDCFGAPVVEASRLCASAEGGQILCADLVRSLARGRGDHRFRSLGEMTLKGLPDPVVALEVAWQCESERLPLPRALAPRESLALAGRQPELEELGQAFKNARAGDRQLLFVSGEPGVGKTRLAIEACRRAHDAGASVLYGTCTEDLGLPFQPFAEALGHVFTHSGPATLRERLGRHPADLVRLQPDLSSVLPGLGPPLRSDPDTER